MWVLLEGIEEATDLFRLQANCLLARRDAVLASFVLSERDCSIFWSLLSNSSEFFGFEAASLFRARQKGNQQVALEHV